MTITVDEIIARAGGAIELSYRLKISQFAIREWRFNGIPRRHWETLTHKAGVTVEEIWEASRCAAEATRARRGKARNTS
jgi:hypothetical protein